MASSVPFQIFFGCIWFCVSSSIIPVPSWTTTNFSRDNPCYICRLFSLIWNCNFPHFRDFQPLAFGIPPILSKNRFHHSTIKYCNFSRTILIQLCSINHYWLSFLRSYVPPAKKHQFALDMRACACTHAHRTNIIQEITASHLENRAEMLSLCLKTNHARDTWFCSQDQIGIHPTSYPPGTCIECFLCLQGLKTLPTNFHQISNRGNGVTRTQFWCVAHGKNLYVHLAVLA